MLPSCREETIAVFETITGGHTVITIQPTVNQTTPPLRPKPSWLCTARVSTEPMGPSPHASGTVASDVQAFATGLAKYGDIVEILG